MRLKLALVGLLKKLDFAQTKTSEMGQHKLGCSRQKKSGHTHTETAQIVRSKLV